jgi:S-DNA-T family DNA segregation ATPase FtsK/SpoIIIE
VARKSGKKSNGTLSLISRVLTSFWRGIAKAFGATIRTITKGARDLDPEHQRDGFGLLLLIVALVSAATSWWRLDNWFGDAAYSFFYGGFERQNNQRGSG